MWPTDIDFSSVSITGVYACCGPWPQLRDRLEDRGIADSLYGKRSRPALVHPSVVATAEATLGAPPRDIDYEPIIAQMVDEAAERVRQRQLRKLA